MLDDHHRRILPGKLGGQFERSIGVVEVVVRKLLALQLGRLRHAGGAGDLRDIDRRRLVRVLAIAQRIGALEGEREGVGEQGRLVRSGGREGEPAGDRGIIGGGAGIGLARHAGAESLRGGTAVRFHLGDQRRVIGRIGEDRHEAVVLRRRAHHRRAADVDVLDHFLAARALGDGRFEGIEVDHHQIDRADPVGLHRGDVLGIVAQSEQPAMHSRVQGLHPPVHHLGKAGEFRHILHGKACIAQGLGGAAGADQLDAARREGRAKFSQTALVGH